MSNSPYPRHGIFTVTVFVACIVAVSFLTAATTFTLAGIYLEKNQLNRTVEDIKAYICTLNPSTITDKTVLDAFLDQAETFSKNGLDMNALEVLFGVFGLIFVSFSAVLLARNEEATRKNKDQFDKTEAELKRQYDKLEEVTRQTNEKFEKAQTNLQERYDSLEIKVKEKTDNLLSQVESQEDRVQKIPQKVDAFDTKLLFLEPLADSLAFGSKINALMLRASFFSTTIQRVDDIINPDSKINDFRDITFFEMPGSLKQANENIGIERLTYNGILDLNNQIIAHMKEVNLPDLQEQWEKIKKMLGEGEFPEKYETLIKKFQYSSI
jgi:hypothetical protein